MIQSIQRDTLVEVLLNTLEAERYVRGPLLANIVDELTGDSRLCAAADVAQALLARLDRIGHAEFVRTVREIRHLVREACPSSGVVATRYSIAPIAGAA